VAAVVVGRKRLAENWTMPTTGRRMRGQHQPIQQQAWLDTEWWSV